MLSCLPNLRPGNIPKELGKLVTLKKLDLSFNELEGELCWLSTMALLQIPPRRPYLKAYCVCFLHVSVFGVPSGISTISVRADYSP